MKCSSWSAISTLAQLTHIYSKLSHFTFIDIENECVCVCVWRGNLWEAAQVDVDRLFHQPKTVYNVWSEHTNTLIWRLMWTMCWLFDWIANNLRARENKNVYLVIKIKRWRGEDLRERAALVIKMHLIKINLKLQMKPLKLMQIKNAACEEFLWPAKCWKQTHDPPIKKCCFDIWEVGDQLMKLLF